MYFISNVSECARIDAFSTTIMTAFLPPHMARNRNLISPKITASNLIARS